MALAVSAGVILLAGITFAGLQLAGAGGDEGEEPASTPAAERAPGGGGRGERQAAVDPSSVTVAVLNGTTVTGLAADVGDQVASKGFQLGNITNSTDTQRAESVVLYATGAEREAADVARRLRIAQREKIDPESQGQAGDASVVVVVGEDKSE